MPLRCHPVMPLPAGAAAVARATAERDVAGQQVVCTRQLVEQNVVPRVQVDRALTASQAGARREDLERAAAEAEAARAAQPLAERQLAHVGLASPVDGEVSVRLSEAGGVMAAGQPVLCVR